MLCSEHLQRGKVEGRGAFSPALLLGLLLCRRRVGEQGAAHKADRQREYPQRPERPPDPLHRAKALQRRADESGQERTAQAHRAANDPRGKALAPGVPFLGAGLDGRVEKRRAQPRRNAEHCPEPYPLLPGQEGRRKEPAAEQAGAPQRRAARAFFILQKTTDDASHPERCDQDAERIASAVLGQAELIHHRLLEHAPRRRQARQDLNGRPRRQDGPRMFCCKLLFHCLPSEWFFPYSVPISIDKTADSFIMDKVTTKHGLALSVIAARCHLPQSGRLWQSTQSLRFCQGLSLWESWTRSGLRGRAGYREELQL